MISLDTAWARGAGTKMASAAIRATDVRDLDVFCIRVFILSLPKPYYKGWKAKISGRHSEISQCWPLIAGLLVDGECCAAVLLPARFVVLGAELLFLAVADGAQPVGAHTGGNQRLLGGVGAVFTECQVVFHRAALVAISADDHLQFRMLVQVVGVLLNCGLSIRTDGIAVVVVEHVLDVLVEDFIGDVAFPEIAGSRRSIYGNARAGRGISAVACGRQRVGSGFGRVHVAGSGRGNLADAFNFGGVRVGGVPCKHNALAGIDAIRLRGNGSSGCRSSFSGRRWRGRGNLLFVAAGDSQHGDNSSNQGNGALAGVIVAIADDGEH